MYSAQQPIYNPDGETQENKGNKVARTIITNRNLFSSYYIGTLLEKDTRKRQGEVGLRQLKSARTRLQHQWNRSEPTFGSLTSYRRTREAWLNTLLQALGYEPLEDARPADFKERALPDGYLLYRPTPVPTFDQPVEPIQADLHVQLDLLNLPATEHEPVDEDEDEDEESGEQSAPPPPEMNERKEHGVLFSLLAWGDDFDRPFTQKIRRNETPHKLMERLLASGGPARWGILCNGRAIRLLKQDVITGRQQYLEVNLEALFDSGNAQDELTESSFTTFWTLFRAQAFQLAADDLCFLDEVDRKSRDHAAGVSTRLKESVFSSLEELMTGLVNHAYELLNASTTEARARERAQEAFDKLPELHRQSLVFLYRLLFVLYAESRTLLPLDNTVYLSSYSLDPLRHEILASRTPYLPDSYRLWETLQSLFRLIHWGCNTAKLVVPAYDGNLFDPQSTYLLNAIRVSDKTLANVIRHLSETPLTRERGRELIDYRDLGVEQLGAVYEGLLELEPHIAKELMVEVQYKGVKVIIPEREKKHYEPKRFIKAGEFYLGRGAGRKTSGSYYTPQTLVDFLVRRTLEPLVQGKSPQEILELKVVDPAMGSGAFLVGACLYLANAYALAVKREEDLLSLERISDSTTTQQEQAETEETLQPYRRVAEAQGVYNIGATTATMPGGSGTEFVTQRGGGVTDTLSEDATRPYRRLIAERCLYGVDLNPMAVELAKVSLWLITLAGDRPLTFLDANLRCGNSLISAPLHVADYGKGTFTIYSIHPEANKLIAKERGGTVLSRSATQGSGPSLWDTEQQSEDEEKEPYTLDDEMDDVQKTVPALVGTRRWIAERPSETVSNVHDKTEQFRSSIVENGKRKMLAEICNLWVATWFWKPSTMLVRPDDPNWVPPLDGQIYTHLVNYIRWSFGEDVAPTFKIDPGPYFRAVEKIIETVNPLHWELEFPEVYFEPDGRPLARPGFHAVLGNPPWDNVKPDSQEFFTTYDPGFREMESVKAGERQEELLKDLVVYSAWNEHVSNLDGQTNYVHLSEIYSYQSAKVDDKQTGGDVNTYKLFLERAYELLYHGGKLGIIVPSGIYSDLSCTGLRQLFIQQAHISYLICFENRKKIFPIDSRFKFVLFGVNKAVASGEFDAVFILNNLETLPISQKYAVNVPESLIEHFAPGTLSIMELRSLHDLDIVTRIYGNRHLLGEEVNEFWQVHFTSEFHMTNNRKFFNQEGIGWSLFEGKMIHQYTDRYKDPRYHVKPERGNEELSRREIQRVEKALDKLAIELSRSRNTTTRKKRVVDLLKRSGRGPINANDVRIDSEAYRLAFRRVARSTDLRALISGIIPPNSFAGNTVTFAAPWRFDARKAIDQLHDIRSCYKSSLPAPVLAYLCGVFNSFTIDYIIRLKIDSDINNFYVYQLPVPRLTPDDQHCKAIASRVARLVCVGPEFNALRQELLGDVNAYVATEPAERRQLQNEIDALVAHLYGLNRDDLEHILYAPYTFWLVKREIKDGVMEAFGRVEELLHEDV